MERHTKLTPEIAAWEIKAAIDNQQNPDDLKVSFLKRGLTESDWKLALELIDIAEDKWTARRLKGWINDHPRRFRILVLSAFVITGVVIGTVKIFPRIFSQTSHQEKVIERPDTVAPEILAEKTEPTFTFSDPNFQSRVEKSQYKVEVYEPVHSGFSSLHLIDTWIRSKKSAENIFYHKARFEFGLDGFVRQNEVHFSLDGSEAETLLINTTTPYEITGGVVYKGNFQYRPIKTEHEIDWTLFMEKLMFLDLEKTNATFEFRNEKRGEEFFVIARYEKNEIISELEIAFEPFLLPTGEKRVAFANKPLKSTGVFAERYKLGRPKIRVN